MGVSCRYVSSILLCPEDSNSTEQDMADGGILRDFTLQSEDCVGLTVERESLHLPQGDYVQRFLRGQLGMAVRNDAIDWIQKQDEAWMTQLLSVACLSLAAKVEETEAPLSVDLQVGEVKYVFESRTIQRMELLVLSSREWRIQAVTPFSFIDYFLCKFSDGNPPDSSVVSQSVELILGTVRGTDFLDFRPAEIAAAVALSSLKEIRVLQIDKDLACRSHVDKGRVLRSHELIQEMRLRKKRRHENSRASASSVTRSPIGVLEAARVSYESDDTTVGTRVNCHSLSPAAKRRKLNRASTS